MEVEDLPDLPLPAQIGLDLEKKAKALGIKYLIPTLHSLSLGIQGPIIPVSAIKRLACNGFNIHGFADFGYGGEVSECYAVPDVSTFTQLPWKPTYAWMACHLYMNGKISSRCPRYALIRQIKRLRELGYILKTGVEPEFFILAKDDIKPGNRLGNGYQAMAPTLCYAEFLTKLLDSMDQLGWKPYQAEKEGGIAQYEMSFDYSDALTTADRACFFKFMAKDIAQDLGFRVSFMPYLAEFVFGNGLHVHQSLWDAETGKNMMPGDGDLHLSEKGRYWVAGLLNHLDGLTVLGSPTINSYKRLHFKKNLFNFHGYGVGSRFCPIRIVQANDNTYDRIEYRAGDSSANPYMLHAGLCAAGIDGLQKQEEPNPLLRNEEPLWDESTPKHSRPMPKSLEAAINALKEDTILKSAIGDDVINAMFITKIMETDAYYREITNAEKALVDIY